ncbi:MAG: YncE family protein [Myxococcales bacterium]
MGHPPDRYTVNGQVVWGATGRIVKNLLEVVAPVLRGGQDPKTVRRLASTAALLLAACAAHKGAVGSTGGGNSRAAGSTGAAGSSSSGSGGGSSGGSSGSTGGSGGAPGGSSTGGTGAVVHELYVLPNDGSGVIDVYGLDDGFALAKSVPVAPLAGTTGIRGAIATAVTGTLYVTWQPNNLLAYDLIHDRVLWTQAYSGFSVDSLALTPDGKTIYLSPGDWVSNGVFEVLDAATGVPTGSIDTSGIGPHDIVVTLDGSKVFLGPMQSNDLFAADTVTDTVALAIGPVADGVRPFTLNGKATLAFINTSGLTGFYSADATTGKILYTSTPPGFGKLASCGGSHGVSLSPDEKEIYLVDCSYSYAHVFDVTGLPGSAPVDVADIPLATPMRDEGWLDHTRDGRYVAVGSCGDVIDTRTRQVAGHLPALETTKIFTEVDFQDGVPIFSPLSREQGGYVQ